VNQLALKFNKPRQTTTRIEAKFLEFHRDNPFVYSYLVKRARQAKSKGFDNYSINSLFEILRWHTNIETRNSVFKLNNNYRSYYARMIMRKEPDLKDFFHIRKNSIQIIE